MDSLTQDDRDLIQRFEAAGQGHVFAFLPDLSRDEATALLEQARGIDLDLVTRLHREADGAVGKRRIEPPGPELVRRRTSDDYRRMRNAASERGMEALLAGKVAVVIAAGGQGTRLGSRDPKGMFPVGPITGKPLFQWHIEKIRHFAGIAGRAVPVVIMVSDATDEATRTFLAAHDHFGLAEEDVHFVKQASLPPLDGQGRLLLSSRSSISMAPNGHGGLYPALVESGVLDTLEQGGTRVLSYIQIDNPLVRPVDPTFIGFHSRAESLISSKSVLKRHPGEKVGVFGRVDGQVSILEYSELSDRQAHEVNEDGQLTFGQGSIAAHCIDTAFARQMAADGLPYHRAHKKVAFVNADGELVRPDEPNATKFETFLFDAIPRAARALVLETAREEEFAPIKNATGDDSPATCRAALIAQFKTWYSNAQLPVPEGEIELDPLEIPDERTFQRRHGA